MTTIDSVATGAVQYLAPMASITAVLGAFPSNDPIAGNAGKPFLFSGDLLIDVRSFPGTIAVVLRDRGGWTVPPPYNTWRFRRLQADFYVDPTRDVNGNVTETSSLTEQRGMAAFRVFQSVLHRRDPDTVLWGDMVTVQCMLLTEPDFAQWPAASGSGLSTQVGTAFWGVAFTGWTDAAA